MKLVTTARHLRAALRSVSLVVERRNTMPILGCAVIDGRTIRGADLDMELQVEIPASVAEGSVAIDCRSLAALLKHIPGDDVVTIKGNAAEVTVGFNGGRYDLVALASDSFPDLKFADGASYDAADASFGRALSFVRRAISIEETRYCLEGVCLSADADGKPVMVATDGHRMAVFPMGSDPALHANNLIIPRKAADILHKLPEPDRAIVGDPSLKMRFTWPGMRLTTKLIEGKFPDWRRVQPKIIETSPSVMMMNRRDLDRVLSRIGAMAGKRSNCVNIAFGSDRSVVTLHQPGAVSAREFLPATTENVDAGKAISFNVGYLRDALAMFAGHDDVAITLSGDGAPARITAAETEAFVILMPMRGEPELALKALREPAEEEPVKAAA